MDSNRFKAGDKVHVRLPNGVEWDDEVDDDYHGGVHLKQSRMAVTSDRITPLTPPIAPGTVVEAWDNHEERRFFGIFVGYRGGKPYITFFSTDHEGARKDHVRPLAVKARRWEDLTAQEQYEWTIAGDWFQKAFSLITSGSEYLIVEATP